jgi:predicted  nucleic acid-binding Zn-ribbon protein
LASDNEQAELDAAFADLDKLVRHLGDELASFRRRALNAEARVKALETSPGTVRAERIEKLERENANLKIRLEKARGRTQQMLDRVRFLRQQHETASR